MSSRTDPVRRENPNINRHDGFLADYIDLDLEWGKTVRASISAVKFP